jgi:hypothetical protein
MAAGVVSLHAGSDSWVSDLNALGVVVLTDASEQLDAGADGGRSDEVNCDFLTGDEFWPPVHADEARDALADFVTYGGTDWELAPADAGSGVLGESWWPVGLPELAGVAP